MGEALTTYITPGTKVPKAFPGSFGDHTLIQRLRSAQKETDDPEWANEVYYLLERAANRLDELERKLSRERSY